MGENDVDIEAQRAAEVLAVNFVGLGVMRVESAAPQL